MSSRPELPSGTVTFLFTDIEGSTQLLKQLGRDRYETVLAEHGGILRTAFSAHDGQVVDTQGDSFFVAFRAARDAVAAAADAQRELAAHEWPDGTSVKVRMGLHSGEPKVGAERYVGIGVHRAARIGAVAHGGQVLLSAATRELVEDDPPEEIVLRALGSYRLKDIDRPERISQLVAEGLRAEFPPLRGETSSGRHATMRYGLALAPAQKPKLEQRLSLPSPANPLIGRQEELQAISDLLLGEARLVTVTGAGGSGKTRLALEVATSLAPQYGRQVCFVPLAPIREAELLATTIMSVLGISEAASEPPLETLKHSLQEQPLLLVLDNFEHLLEAAPVLAELLAECTRLTLLVTSRASLHLSGEHVYPLDPLPLRQAIALFTERARAVRLDFAGDEAVLTAICERLDCLPLALELAAARSRLLSPQELLTRLEHRLELLTGGPRDLSDRQRTLRATIDWSYELLEREEQQRFASLAVFTGGCTLQAAERVCSASLDQLDSLVDMNLLKRREAAGEGRFWMLGTIREHALERLEARGETEGLRRRHAEHFLAFAEEARGFARGPRETEWFDRIELELDNIRTALAWAVERPEGVLGLRLVEALEPYWYRRSHLREGLQWLESLLELGAAAPPAIRAGALGLAGRLAFELGGEDARVRPWYEESLVLARASGDRTREAWALHGLGALAWRDGDHDRARNLFEQSLELFLELGQHGPAGGRLSYLAELALETGDTHAARKYFERSIEEYAAAGDDSGVAGSMAGVGEVALVEGDFEAALRSYCAALPRTTEPTNLVWILAGMAAAAAATGRATEAARLWGASQRLHQEIDQPMGLVERARYEKHLGSLDEREVAVGSALTTADAVALGRRLLGQVATR